jgi:hypothetical protein
VSGATSRVGFATQSLLLGVLLAPFPLSSQQVTGAPLPKMTAVPDIRISPEQHDLTDVGFIAWARDGSVAIGQAQDQAIRYFNAQGNPIGRIGRSGEGPGEFRMMLRAGWLGDTLWVFDNMLRRVTLIAPPIRLLRSLPVPQTARLASGVEIKYGTVAGFRSAKDLDLLAIIESPLRSAYARVALPAATATLIYSDSLAECSTELPGGKTFHFPFCPRGAKRVNPQGGSLVAVRQSRAQQERGEFTVTRAGARGFTRTYTTNAPPLPRATLDSAVDAVLKRGKLSSAQASAARSRTPRPSRYAAAEIVVPGRDGSIFVGHSGPVLRRWTVIRSDGVAAFEFDLPKATFIHAVSLQALWAVEVDEDGVETPVRYRLVPR